MIVTNSSLADTLGTAHSPLRVNPAVVVGLGHFGGATLRRLADRLRPIHPALVEGMGWLWLTGSGWRADWPDSLPNPAGTSDAQPNLAPEPLAQALDQATSQANVAALEAAGYEPGTTLDTLVVARIDDPLTRAMLWPLLDLIRAQPPLRENRVTLTLACDSRRFVGSEASELAEFFGALAERLAADRTEPSPGALAWCYVCDTLDLDSRLLGSDGASEAVVWSQGELVEGFLALLLGSGLRRDPAYTRTALPQLAHDTSAPVEAALVSSFGLGAYALPVEAIAALARDRLALRLHEVAFPPKSSVADRDAAWVARDRLLTAVDLSPQGLGERLLRGPDGAPIRFDTQPPDLADLDQETTLQALAYWRNGLEEAWTDENAAPSVQIAGNAEALLAELSDLVEEEVDELIQTGPRGVHQAMVFLDELPQTIERARVQIIADDKYYLKMSIPSIDQKFRELGESAIQMERWWWSLTSLTLLSILILLSSPSWLAAGLLVLLWFGAVVYLFWGSRRRLSGRQAEFIDAVRLKYRLLQEREMHVRRRGLFDELIEVVRQERQTLFAWKDAVKAVQATLAEASAPAPSLACSERLLCEPGDYPSPVDDYDEEKIAEIAAHYLGLAECPPWRQSGAAEVVAWLRAGAEAALVSWRRSISVASWRQPEPSQAIAWLVGQVQPQWPLAANERRQVELKLVGLPDKDELALPQSNELGQLVSASTWDFARLTFVPTYHGLDLKRLAAVRPLWEALNSPPPAGEAEAGPGPDADLQKTFAWRYAPEGDPEEHQVELTISQSSYQAFRAEPRRPRGQWAGFVTASAPELDALVAAFGRLHRQKDWSRLKKASNVLAFVQQCIRYDSDLHTTVAGEWPRYPLETLVDGVGDCEDNVILAAAVLKRMGFNVALLYYPGHCALGVAGAEDLPGVYVEDSQTGVRYFYGETTAKGWSLGQVPPKYRQMSPEGIEVVRMMVE